MSSITDDQALAASGQQEAASIAGYLNFLSALPDSIGEPAPNDVGMSISLDKMLYSLYYLSMRKRMDDTQTTGQAEPERQLHNRIAVLRAERGLSRQDLADALDVNYQTIGYIERGNYNPSLELAFRLSEFFGLPIETIFSRTPFRPLSEELYGRTDQRPGAGKE